MCIRDRYRKNQIEVAALLLIPDDAQRYQKGSEIEQKMHKYRPLLVSLGIVREMCIRDRLNLSCERVGRLRST